MDKIQGALSDLEQEYYSSVPSKNKDMLIIRLKELRLMQAELTSFFLKYEDSLPFVPPSRCKAILVWYRGISLIKPRGFYTFQKELIAADKQLMDHAEFLINDEHLPVTLRKNFEEHIARLKMIQIHEQNAY